MQMVLLHIDLPRICPTGCKFMFLTGKMALKGTDF